MGIKVNWGIALLAVLLAGCGKPMPDEFKRLDPETRALRQDVNMFAWDVMDTYYLWRDEISPAMDAWQNWEEPIAKIASIRYKDAAGEDIDRWTELTDDFAAMKGGISGYTRTLGMDFSLYYVDKSRQNVCAVVTYVYADSPAAKAGLGRGDVILTLDGREMTPDNYRDLVRSTLLGGGTVRLGLDGGASLTVTAVDMYENPVHTVRILDRPDGRKVGYLHYTSFTLDSCKELSNVFRSFTQEGIDDLVLDLRYNGGGYVTAETVLASMLAPLQEVEAKSVFSREVYNESLAEELDDKPTCFDTGFTFHVNDALQVVTTKGCNPDLKRLYVLVTGGSASASESLICGLKPYMDVILVGNRTYGKYCAGLLINAENWLDSVKKYLKDGDFERAQPHLDNWGLYVMYARYADCNGVTLSMPDGIAPDVELDDDPLDGHPLGDPDETLLSAALALMEGRPVSGGTRTAQCSTVSGGTRTAEGGTVSGGTRAADGGNPVETGRPTGGVSPSASPALLPVPDAPRRPGFGLLVSERPVN